MRRRALLVGGEVEPTILTAIYNVTSTTTPTKIGYDNYTSGFSSIEIDGVEQPSVVSAYTFSTLGEHTVKYTLTEERQIGGNAFRYCTSLTSIDIPNGVTSIGNYAFDSCSGLTSIYIPSSVTSISVNPWLACSGLTAITVDGGNTTYDSRNGCNAIIGTRNNVLVTGCQNTVIPSSVTRIGSYAFGSCYGLTSIVIPSSVTLISSYAFQSCGSLTSINIPSGVTTIESYSFSYCRSLTSINIPSGVTSIGVSAFQYCYGLTSITIPSGVTSISTNPWQNCSGLTAITVDSSNTKFDSRNNCNAIIRKSTNELIAGCKNTVIPNSVTSIGTYAFRGCNSLTSIDIPNSVTSIGVSAFQYCYGLTSIDIPSAVTSIGSYAFQYCSKLASVTCRPTTPPTLGTNVFNSNASGRKIYVPSASVATYKAATNWSSYASYIYAIT